MRYKMRNPLNGMKPSLTGAVDGMCSFAVLIVGHTHDAIR
jgi:hypothetical protein